MKPLGIHGGVHLGCRTNEDGFPYLSSQRFSPPIHLSKPYYDENTGSLLIDLSNPTAGLSSGDRIVCDIEVSALASVVVTSPGTSCSHYMQFRVAKVDQKFSVHDVSLLRNVFLLRGLSFLPFHEV